jgi:transcriptional regulator with XRE-family HTH domain
VELYKTPAETSEWLNKRLAELSIPGLQGLSDLTGINKGTLSKYFRQAQSPSIAVVPQLCNALQVSPETLLVALGVLSRSSVIRK